MATVGGGQQPDTSQAACSSSASSSSVSSSSVSSSSVSSSSDASSCNGADGQRQPAAAADPAPPLLTGLEDLGDLAAKYPPMPPAGQSEAAAKQQIAAKAKGKGKAKAKPKAARKKAKKSKAAATKQRATDTTMGGPAKRRRKSGPGRAESVSSEREASGAGPAAAAAAPPRPTSRRGGAGTWSAFATEKLKEPRVSAWPPPGADVCGMRGSSRPQRGVGQGLAERHTRPQDRSFEPDAKGPERMKRIGAAWRASRGQAAAAP